MNFKQFIHEGTKWKYWQEGQFKKHLPSKSWAAYWKNTLTKEDRQKTINIIEKYIKEDIPVETIPKQPEFEWENKEMVMWVLTNFDYCKGHI